MYCACGIVCCNCLETTALCRAVKFIAALTVVVASLAPPVAQAQPLSPLLEPTTAWNVDYAESECRLLRSFGRGDQAITLRLARGGNPEAVDVIIAGPGIPKLAADVSLDMKLDPQGLSQSTHAMSMAIPSGGGRFIRWLDAGFSLFDQAAPNQIVAFSSGKAFSTRLNATMLRDAMKALDACYADLLKGWGAGPEDVAIMVAARSNGSEGSGTVTAQRLDLPTVKGNPAAWVTPMDYPTEALRKEQNGTVIVLLEIAGTGRPSACRVVVSSKVESLDTTTCRLLQDRAHYRPPVDAAGQPRRSIKIERIRWLIPRS